MLASPKARVVIADPNWSYQNWTDAKRGAAKAHYACTSVEELAKLPVKDWVDPDGAILALWGVFPKLCELVDLGRAWGFEHVTGVPWLKTTNDLGAIRSGCGFWVRGAAEVLTFWRRAKRSGGHGALRLREGFVGTVRAAGVAKGTKSMTPVGLLEGCEDELPGTHFYAPRGKHSAKPLLLHEWLEKRYDGPYLELFARNKRPGWTCWGDELGVRLTPEGAVECEPVRYAPSSVRRGKVKAVVADVQLDEAADDQEGF